MAGPRPRRRPFVLVGVAALITLVLVLAEAGRSSHPSSGQAVQAYLDQVRPGVEQSATEGSDFADVRTNAPTLGRDAIDRRLDRLAGEVAATLQSVETLTPPPSMRVPHAYLVATLGVRAKAVREARPAMDAALTPEASAVADAVGQLYTVGQDISLGDRAFQLFMGALPRGVQMPAAPAWITDANAWVQVQLTAFVDLLRASTSARPVHDIAVLAFQTDPGPVSIAQDGTQTIPAAAKTTVSIVVENVGNQPERSVEVRVILDLGGGVQQSLRDFVDLTPGASRAVGPLVSLHTQTGMKGRLTVEIVPPQGDTDQTNDVLSVPVSFR